MEKCNCKKFRTFLKDVADIFLLRLKLITKDTAALTALILSLLIFTIVIHALSASSDTQSSLPIGIVDNDKSEESGRLIERLKKVPSLRLVEKKEDELHKLLLDEMVSAIFIIQEGYEERLEKGDLDEVISMYYIKDNKSASIISDIIAGEMIYPVSLYKSMRLYEGISYKGSKHSRSDYKAYIKELLADSGDFDFAFEMIYENPDRKAVDQEPITNALLYNQLIFGILGILISFIAMFIMSGVVREKEIGVSERLKISKFFSVKQDFGNVGALLFTEGLIALAFSLLVYRQLHTMDGKLFLSSFLLILLYAVVLGFLFNLISKMVKSIITYQMFCSALILITGGLGFYHLLTGFYQMISGDLLKIIPNSWFIQGFTDIIIYGKEEGIFNDGHRMLFLLAVALFSLILIVDTAGNKFRRRYRIKENNGMG